MFEGNRSFEELVLKPSGHVANLTRFCLSDNIPINIDEVVYGKMTPIEYGGKLLKRSYRLLYKEHFETTLGSLQLPEIINRSLVFDDVVSSACLLRAIAVQSARPGLALELTRKVKLFFLCGQNPHIDEMSYSGLGFFEIYAKDFIRSVGKGFVAPSIDGIESLVKSVSHVHDHKWILNDSRWKKALLAKPSRLRVFRAFLHAAFFSFTMEESHIDQIYLMSRSDILTLIQDFADLRTSDKAKVEDVEEFIRRLAMYFEPLPQNMFYSSILEGCFDFFADIHGEHIGNTFAPNSPLRTKSIRG